MTLQFVEQSWQGFSSFLLRFAHYCPSLRPCARTVELLAQVTCRSRMFVSIPVIPVVVLDQTPRCQSLQFSLHLADLGACSAPVLRPGWRFINAGTATVP